jgi:hypothetical protein
MKANEYIQACLDRLIAELAGLTITGGVVDDTGEYWGFTARGELKGQTVEKTVFVLADPEGNGPGFLEISEDEEPDPAATSGHACCVREAPGEEVAVLASTSPRFSLGRVVATPGALAALEGNGQSGAYYLARHVRGDFGDLCEDDKRANVEALREGLRLLSAYRLSDGTRIWVISEADRSVTTLLLPEEY